MKIFLVRDKENNSEWCGKGWRSGNGSYAKPEIYFSVKNARTAIGHKPPYRQFYDSDQARHAALMARYEIVECDLVEVGVVCI